MSDAAALISTDPRIPIYGNISPVLPGLVHGRFRMDYPRGTAEAPTQRGGRRGGRVK